MKRKARQLLLVRILHSCPSVPCVGIRYVYDAEMVQLRELSSHDAWEERSEALPCVERAAGKGEFPHIAGKVGAVSRIAASL